MSENTGRDERQRYAGPHEAGEAGQKHAPGGETKQGDAPAMAEATAKKRPAASGEAPGKTASASEAKEATTATTATGKSTSPALRKQALAAEIVEEARAARKSGAILPARMCEALDELEIVSLRQRLAILREVADPTHEEANEILALVQSINSLRGSETVTHQEIKKAAGAEGEADWPG